MYTISFSPQAPIEPTSKLMRLLTQLGKQILLSSEKLPKEKLLDIFRCSADRVEILCEYTKEGFLEFYIDSVSDYRIHFDDSIIGKVKAECLPMKKIRNILHKGAPEDAEILMGNIFVIYPDARAIKFLFHNSEVHDDEINSIKNTEICQYFSDNCTDGMNIIKLYQNEISNNIKYLKGLLEDFEKQILTFYSNLPRQKLTDACNDVNGRVEITCTYAKSGRFTFYIGDDENHNFHRFIGRVDGKKGLTKDINAFLAKKYPGIKISNKCIIHPATRTIEFFFKFKTSLKEGDLVNPFLYVIKFSEECTKKRKVLQDEFLWIFSADLIKMQNPCEKLFEKWNGEGTTLYNIVNITAFGKRTLLFETAEFKVELPLIDSLKI